MFTVNCTECDGEIKLDDHTESGEIIVCPDCGVDLEVIGLNPVVVEFLREKKSAYALPAELALRCGLREDEMAGMQGQNIDVKQNLLHITGKGGRYRPVPIPEDLIIRLNRSK